MIWNPDQNKKITYSPVKITQNKTDITLVPICIILLKHICKSISDFTNNAFSKVIFLSHIIIKTLIEVTRNMNFVLFCQKCNQFIAWSCTNGGHLSFQCPFENMFGQHIFWNTQFWNISVSNSMILVINSTTIIEIRYTCRLLYWTWFSVLLTAFILKAKTG